MRRGDRPLVGVGAAIVVLVGFLWWRSLPHPHAAGEAGNAPAQTRPGAPARRASHLTIEQRDDLYDPETTSLAADPNQPAPLLAYASKLYLSRANLAAAAEAYRRVDHAMWTAPATTLADAGTRFAVVGDTVPHTCEANSGMYVARQEQGAGSEAVFACGTREGIQLWEQLTCTPPLEVEAQAAAVLPLLAVPEGRPLPQVYAPQGNVDAAMQQAVVTAVHKDPAFASLRDGFAAESARRMEHAGSRQKLGDMQEHFAQAALHRAGERQVVTLEARFFNGQNTAQTSSDAAGVARGYWVLLTVDDGALHPLAWVPSGWEDAASGALVAVVDRRGDNKLSLLVQETSPWENGIGYVRFVAFRDLAGNGTLLQTLSNSCPPDKT